MNIRTSYIKYISGLILFGLNGIISSHIHLASYDIVFFRTLLGSLFFIMLCTMRGIKIHNKEDSPQQFIFAVLSGVSLGLSWIFLYEAYQRIGVGLSSISYYCGPVIVMLMSPIIFRERLGFMQIISFINCFCGNASCFTAGTYRKLFRRQIWSLLWLRVRNSSCPYGHFYNESSRYKRCQKFSFAGYSQLSYYICIYTHIRSPYSNAFRRCPVFFHTVFRYY